MNVTPSRASPVESALTLNVSCEQPLFGESHSFGPVAGITDRYIELYEHITGVPFVKAEDPDPAARIEKNIDTFLKSL